MTERNYLQCSATYTEPARTTASYQGNWVLRTAQHRWQQQAGSPSKRDASVPPSCESTPLAAVAHTGMLACSSPQRGVQRITCEDPQEGSRAPCAAHGVDRPGFCSLEHREGRVEPISGPPAFGVEVPSGSPLSLLTAEVSPVPLVFSTWLRPGSLLLWDLLSESRS